MNANATNLSQSPRLIYAPSYLEPYSFEVYDAAAWYDWMNRCWWVVLPLCALYLILLHLGQGWMTSRTPFSLRTPLLLWNIILASGSAFMFIRMVHEPWVEIRAGGLYHTICNRDNHTIISSYWTLVFTLSKVLEFGDTAFIVLRKQRLIFLHPYHHVTVALYTFYTFGPQFDPAGRIFGPTNALIHTLMYSYYGGKSMGLKMPKGVAKMVTSLQILQMFLGLGVNLISLGGKVGVGQGGCRDRPWANIGWALVMYSSYLVLFLKFYKSSYGGSKVKVKDTKDSNSTEERSQNKKGLKSN